MSIFQKYITSSPAFWLFQLFRIFPNSFVHFIRKQINIFSWFSFLLLTALLFLIFWFGALGSRLYEAPNFDLLFGIFFKDILIPMFLILVAWYIIALKFIPEKVNEYYFLNSIPISNRTVFFHFLLMDIFRFLWIPGGLFVLYFGLKSFTPTSFLIRLNILTILVFGLSIILNILLQLLFSIRKNKKGGFGYPAQSQPMVQFLVILFFLIIQLMWIIFPGLNIGFIFWLIVLLLTVFILLGLVSTYSIFKKWQTSNACFKFEGAKKRAGKANYLLMTKISDFLPLLKSNPFFSKNLVKIGVEKSSIAGMLLTMIFICISYLIAMNNENFEDSILVLLGIYGIYSFVFAIRTIYQTGAELESPNLIYSLPIKKHQFYFSVFTFALLWLMIVFSILTIFLIFSGSGIQSAFGFWWRVLFLSLIFLLIALNFAFSSYPEMKIAQKRIFYYLMILTLVTVSFYKYRYGIAVAFTLFSFLQLRRMKLFRAS